MIEVMEAYYMRYNKESRRDYEEKYKEFGNYPFRKVMHNRD